MGDERLGRWNRRVFNLSGLAWNTGVDALGLVEDLSGVGEFKETLRLFRGWPGEIWGVFAAVNEWTVTVTRSVECGERLWTLNGELMDRACAASSE